MSDEAYYSTLEDLEEFAELLSPTSAQSRETTVADSTRQFEFPDPLETSSAIDFGVHADSNMSTDTAKVKQLKGFFVDINPITDVDFAKNEVIIPKNKRGTEGSKEYSSAYALATSALSPKLGAAKHFVTKNEDGETDPGNGSYRNIQEQFVGNYAKIEDAQKHSISYDFMEIVLVRKVEDSSASDLWDKYGEETINLFEDWTHLTIKEVKEWQADINRQGGDENRRSSAWLLAYLRNSCTQELRDGIKDAFEALESFERGGATYLYLIMSHMFQMTTDVVTALKSVVTRFGRDGIAKIKGENVFLAAKQLTAVVKSLARVDALSDEAVSDIMDGLAKGSVTKFTEVFKLDSTLYRSRQTSTTYTGGSQTALGVILLTLGKATDLYNSLSTGNHWHIPSGRVHSCWNCNGDHGVNKCKEPKDQARIAANKKKWEEEKQKKSGHPGTGSGSGSGRSSGNQYERSRFGGKKGNQQPLGSGVAKFNNVWHMFCKSCGWNCTHSSGFHAAFSSNPSSFPAALPATHPYHQQIAKEQRQNLPVPPPTIPSATNPCTGPNTLGMVSIDKAKLLDVCERHERMVADPTVAAFLSDLKKMLN
jgi:hypothetical protein